ncbi:MAG: lytic transglycosylase domain-containing protein [Sphingobium sp.]
MLSAIEMAQCPNLEVPIQVMRHVVEVESSFNPYAIGVVGGALVRQPENLAEAVATARDLEQRGYNFSVGLAQVNRHNLVKYGLSSYEQAFSVCSNLRAGTRILAECHSRAAGDWGKAFSCYYSGNFSTGYQHGYVGKVFASMQGDNRSPTGAGLAIALAPPPRRPDRQESGSTSKGMASGADLTPREIERLADPAFVDAAVTGPALPQTTMPPQTDSRRSALDTVPASLSGKLAADGVASGPVAGTRDDGPVVLAAAVPAKSLPRSEAIESKAEVESSASPPSPPAVDQAFVF